MSKKSEKIIIFVLAGAMLFSSVGTGVLLIGANSNDDNDLGDNSIVDENTDSVTTEDDSTKDDQSTDPDSKEDDNTSNKSDLTIPKAFIPDGDITSLQKVDVKEGSGQEVKAGDTIEVHYHGTLASDGTVFDSSYERGETISFPLTGVIKGWQEGIPGMKVGGIRRLVIPSDLGYGEFGSPPKIGANADLVFVVELISIQN